MKKKIVTFLACSITLGSAVISFYFANLPNPTELQKDLSGTTNTILVMGATAIFGVLEQDQDGSDR